MKEEKKITIEKFTGSVALKIIKALKGKPSMQKIAAEIGVDNSQLSRWLNGKKNMGYSVKLTEKQTLDLYRIVTDLLNAEKVTLLYRKEKGVKIGRSKEEFLSKVKKIAK
jgi:transcriptional regulator with XRE-family HTH domain